MTKFAKLLLSSSFYKQMAQSVCGNCDSPFSKVGKIAIAMKMKNVSLPSTFCHRQ